GREPRTDIAALVAELADAAQRTQERLAGEILGQRAVADPVVDVAEDRVHVAVVEPAECLTVTLLSQRDEPPDVAMRLVHAGRRRGVRWGRVQRGGPGCAPARRLREQR